MEDTILATTPGLFDHLIDLFHFQFWKATVDTFVLWHFEIAFHGQQSEERSQRLYCLVSGTFAQHGRFA